MRYVALGDSYTIGTSLAAAESWPSQLAGRIEELELAANLAENGATTVDVIERQLSGLDMTGPELVSLLIGVNDAVRGVPDSQYAANLTLILGELLARLPPGRLFCVATPDYTVAPRGGEYGDPAEQSDVIVRFNAILREICDQRRIVFVPEIFEISLRVSDDSRLVGGDGLHPTAEQYGLWVDAIEPVVRRLLEA